MKFAAFFLVAVLTAVEGQLQLHGGTVFGSKVARPVVITPVVRKYTTINRQYSTGSGDGQYKADNSGAYNANDGAYHPDDSGSYVHQDQQYRHQDERYKHLGDKFGGAGGGGGGFGGAGAGGGAGGQYQDSVYHGQFGSGVSSGSGIGSKTGFVKVSAVSVGSSDSSEHLGGPVSGSTILAGSGGSSLLGLGLGQKTKIGQGVSGSVYSGVKSDGRKSFGAAGFGEAVALQQGSAQGKYDNKNYGIIRQTGKVEEDGYHYLYETENGILGEEQGKLANRDTDNEAMHATGFFTYTGPDAIVYTVNYVADENGFQPDAAHLPTPPPVPAYILRALDYQRSIGTLVD